MGRSPTSLLKSTRVRWVLSLAPMGGGCRPGCGSGQGVVATGASVGDDEALIAECLVNYEIHLVARSTLSAASTPSRSRSSPAPDLPIAGSTMCPRTRRRKAGPGGLQPGEASDSYAAGHACCANALRPRSRSAIPLTRTDLGALPAPEHRHPQRLTGSPRSRTRLGAEPCAPRRIGRVLAQVR